MGRLKKIEEAVAGTLNDYSYLKMIVRGRPRYLEPQMDKGRVRFAVRRGSNFTGILPNNKFLITENVIKESHDINLETRPSWFNLECLIRLGPTEDIGELHIIQDLINTTGLQTKDPILANYSADDNADPQTFVTLVGTPANFYGISVPPQQRKILFIEFWYPVVPGDSVLLTPTPDVLDSFAPYEIKRADFINTRPGVGDEPAVVYQYEIEIVSDSSLISFDPSIGLRCYLLAQPLYESAEYPSGDLKIEPGIGPFLVDAYYGSLLHSHKIQTKLGLKTWDSFGNQLNAALTGNQEWQSIPENYLVLERPIRSDTFLFWERILGKFQYVKNGFFQAELDENGEFVMSSDQLVPKWPSNRQHGWVIPIKSQSPITISVEFEPQERQYFTIPANTLTYIRPKLFVDPEKKDITKIFFSIKGSPFSRVEIRDWEYDGPAVISLSYFILGAGRTAFGDNRWLAGGFCIKPLFFNLDPLKAKYSDGSSKYNSGYIYL